jgi:predicted metal-dependent hydrolase
MFRPSLFSALVIASLAFGSLRASSPDDDLSALIKKWQTSEGQQQGQKQPYQPDAIVQFKALESALQRRNFDRAQQILQNLNEAYGLPPNLQAEWPAIAEALAALITEQQQKEAIARKKEIDDLTEKTRKLSLEAKTSGDLDEVMIQISALQTQKASSYNSNSLIAQRSGQKLEGLARFVGQWTRFLDFKAAGDNRQANNILRDLMQGATPMCRLFL